MHIHGTGVQESIMNNFLIYKHTSPSGKSYIGQTNNYNKRIKRHFYEGCTALYNAIKKYGWDNLKHEILRDNLTLEEANYWEKFYIKTHNTLYPNGYNLRTGGDNSLHSDYSKKKMSEKKKNKVYSSETRMKMSESSKGIRHTEESKNKISKANKGKIISDEQRKNTSDFMKNRMLNPEIRKQLSNKLMGHKRTPESIEKSRIGNLGRKMSDDNKQKLIAANKLRHAIKRLERENAH